MNVGELLRERDRLLGILEEAKSARSKLKQVNVLIAMYGTPEDVAAVAATNGHVSPAVPLYCETCGDARPFKGRQGLAMHKRRAHGTPGAARQVAKRKAATK
jgi:hypothetical protein